MFAFVQIEIYYVKFLSMFTKLYDTKFHTLVVRWVLPPNQKQNACFMWLLY
jgi:hypothetical protein